jgi:hypothetical protein
MLNRTVAAKPSPKATIMASIDWKRNAEAALEEARRTGRMVLLDFSAAPM